MGNAFDFFVKECSYFRVTQNAREFCKKNNLSLPSGTEEAFGQSSSQGLQLESSILETIDYSKDGIDNILVLNSIMTNLLSCDSDTIISTTEIFLVTDADCGEMVHVFNSNWLYLPPGLQIEKPFINECVIPNKPEKKLEDILGCYIPQYKIIFLWVDRIMQVANSIRIDIQLLFQSALLHEIIHSLLDCNLRDENMDVYCKDAFKSLEETITNTLMLKVYFDTDRTKYDEVLRFVNKQSPHYSAAAMVFSLLQETEGWENFNSNLATYLKRKTIGESTILKRKAISKRKTIGESEIKNDILFGYSVADDDNDNNPKSKADCMHGYIYDVNDFFCIFIENFQRMIDVPIDLWPKEYKDINSTEYIDIPLDRAPSYSCIEIGNKSFYIKRITLLYEQFGEDSYKVYLTYSNDNNKTLYMAIHNVVSVKFEFPLCKGNNAEIKFKSFEDMDKFERCFLLAWRDCGWKPYEPNC